MTSKLKGPSFLIKNDSYRYLNDGISVAISLYVKANSLILFHPFLLGLHTVFITFHVYLFLSNFYTANTSEERLEQHLSQIYFFLLFSISNLFIPFDFVLSVNLDELPSVEVSIDRVGRPSSLIQSTPIQRVWF